MKIVILLFAYMALPNFTSAMFNGVYPEEPSPTSKASRGGTEIKVNQPAVPNFDIPEQGSTIYISVKPGLYLSGKLRNIWGPGRELDHSKFGQVVVNAANVELGAGVEAHDTRTVRRGEDEIIDEIKLTHSHSCYITREGNTTALEAELSVPATGIGYFALFKPPGCNERKGGLLQHAQKRPDWVPADC